MKNLALGLTLIIASTAYASAAGEYWFHCSNENWKQTFKTKKECEQARDKHKDDYKGHKVSTCRDD